MGSGVTFTGKFNVESVIKFQISCRYVEAEQSSLSFWPHTTTTLPYWGYYVISGGQAQTGPHKVTVKNKDINRFFWKK